MASQSVRAFVAVELPEHAKSALAKIAGELRAAQIGGLRVSRAGAIHLTLKFLGDVPRERLDAIGGAVADASTQHGPFALTLSGVGAFPNERAPRVLWAGIGGDLDSLAALQASVEDALADIGFPRERRPYRPHLTLARLRPRATSDDRRRAIRALHRARPQAQLPFNANAIALYQSILTPNGAIHTRLARHSLLKNPP